MAVKLRLKRMGKKKQPTYRIVAADSRSPRDGRFIEVIGTYAPRAEPSLIEVDNARAVEWLAKGAKASEAVRKILEISGAWGEFEAAKPPKSARPARKKSEAARQRLATKAKGATKAKAAKKAGKKVGAKAAARAATAAGAVEEPAAPAEEPGEAAAKARTESADDGGEG